MDTGGADNNVDTRSSNILCTSPTSSWSDRFVRGFRPISSVLDLGGDDYPSDRSGSMIGAFDKVNSVVVDSFIAVTYSSVVRGSEKNRSWMFPIVEQPSSVGSVHLITDFGVAGSLIIGALSSGFLGSDPSCSVPVRSEIGGRALSRKEVPAVALFIGSHAEQLRSGRPRVVVRP